MSTRSDAAMQIVTPSLLRQWSLPDPGSSKYGRGQVLVVGGAARTPGSVLLAGEAALRVGGGHLQLAVAESVAAALAVAVPEAGVIPLPQTATGSVRGSAADRLSDAAAADVVLVGPGLDDADEAADLLTTLVPMLGEEATVVLDAYALGVLPGLDDVQAALRGRLVLTPNSEETRRLLGDEPDDTAGGAAQVADTYGAVVSTSGYVAGPGGRCWQVSTGHTGLGTSGSGDVLAGTVTGLLARGADLDQAACWGTHLHAASGDRLAARQGPLGFLARDLLGELPLLLVELSA
jgi:hydroxyethylthiazole kinase-like uncharacterized protein yjeF